MSVVDLHPKISEAKIMPANVEGGYLRCIPPDEHKFGGGTVMNAMDTPHFDEEPKPIDVTGHMARRYRDELELFEANNDRPLRELGILRKQHVKQLEFVDGDISAMLVRDEAWRKLMSLGFDMYYILWGVRVLNKSDDTPLRAAWTSKT